jgi:hypothetical protein
MNAFDKVAKPKAEASAKKAPKIAATTTKDIKKAVDAVIQLKAQIKELEATELANELAIISHVRPQQDVNARNGNFANAYTVEGETGNVTYVSSDKHSVPKDEEAQGAIKTLIGNKLFADFFDTKRSVNIRPEVLTNDALVNKIVGTLEKAGIENIFDVVDTLVAKKGLDEKVYTLDETKLEQFRALVPPAKPSIR